MPRPEIPLGGSVGLPGSASLLGWNTIAMPDSDFTPDVRDVACLYLHITGNPSQQRTLNLPQNPGQFYVILNDTNKPIALNAADTVIPSNCWMIVLFDDGFEDYIPLTPAISDFDFSFIFNPVGSVDSAHQIKITPGITPSITTNALVLNINPAFVTQLRSLGLSFAISDQPVSGNYDGGQGVNILQGGSIGSITINGGNPPNPAQPFLFFFNISTSNALNFLTGGNIGNAASIPAGGSGFAFWNGTSWQIFAPTSTASQTDVTGLRALGTVFQNGTGSTIMVTGWCTSSGSSVGSLTANVGPTNTPAAIWSNENTASVSGGPIGFNFPVPPGFFYELVGAGDISGLAKWVETTF